MIERGVDVGGWDHTQMIDTGFLRGPRQEVDRNEIHEIHEKDQGENGDRQRPDQAALAVKGFLDRAVDHFDQDLEGSL